MTDKGENKKYKFSTIKESKKELEKIYINGILKFLKEGEFPYTKPDSFISAYSIVVGTCDDGGDSASEDLFKYYNDTISNNLKDFKAIIKSKQPSQLIDLFLQFVDKFNTLTYFLKKVFTYLDRFYTKAKGGTDLSKSAILLFKDTFFEDLKKDLYSEVNKLIREDRLCNKENRPKIEAVLKIIDILDYNFPKIDKEGNIYKWSNNVPPNTRDEGVREYANKWFNNYFRKETEEFIKNKAKTDIDNMNAPEYVNASLKYLSEEKEREEQYINQIFHEKLNKINYQYLVIQNAQKLVEKDTGIPSMFRNKRTSELQKAYELISKDPESLRFIKDEFKPYIRERGITLYENKEILKDPKKFVPELIKLKQEMDNLVINCFENSNDFQDVKKNAFSCFMNKETYAKQLSNYLDYCMRGGFKGKTEEYKDNELKEIIGLFSCLYNKLTFQLDANKKLSDRLIQGKELSREDEKKFISMLKQEQGVQFTSKMNEMMMDLDKNKNESELYRKGKSQGRPNGISFSVQVLSQSAWEINKIYMEKIEYPNFLDGCIKDFENFYLKRHNGHKLIWCLGLSRLEVRYLCFNKKNYQSTSTLPQVLMLLEVEKHNNSLTLKEIAGFLGCNINTILTDVVGLVFHPSYNPQSKKEKGLIIGSFDAQKKEFKETDQISINDNFVSSKTKFSTVPVNTKKTTEASKIQEQEEANITKKYQENILQATLTRIMKSRIGQKTTHVWLIGECRKQVDLFMAQPNQIKENIEKLIEKNIMKRNDKDRTCYDYIA